MIFIPLPDGAGSRLFTQYSWHCLEYVEYFLSPFYFLYIWILTCRMFSVRIILIPMVYNCMPSELFWIQNYIDFIWLNNTLLLKVGPAGLILGTHFFCLFYWGMYNLRTPMERFPFERKICKMLQKYVDKYPSWSLLNK